MGAKDQGARTRNIFQIFRFHLIVQNSTRDMDLNVDLIVLCIATWCIFFSMSLFLSYNSLYFSYHSLYKQNKHSFLRLIFRSWLHSIGFLTSISLICRKFPFVFCAIRSSSIHLSPLFTFNLKLTYAFLTEVGRPSGTWTPTARKLFL